MHYLSIQVFKGINGGGIHAFARALVPLAARPFLGFQHDSMVNLTKIVGPVLTYDNVDQQGDGSEEGRWWCSRCISGQPLAGPSWRHWTRWCSVVCSAPSSP